MGINNLLSDIGLPGLGCKPVLTDSKPRVVIVGAGFGGLAAAEKTAEAGCDVTLIDRNPYTTFQPLLYQVATGGLNPGDATYRLRSFAAHNGPHTHFRRACVTGIDTENRIVEVDNGDPISYDYLVCPRASGPTSSEPLVPPKTRTPFTPVHPRCALATQSSPTLRISTPNVTRPSTSSSLAAARPASKWPAPSPR